ncbi:hypothetical protein ACFPVV_04875 [Macrococcoides bohemicum]|uniref:hypothetical protein n=2 Tax=Macrococcoides bohemicum TaxID=1903056 RepID=UPI0028988894|nr:hypothetical protein [Macrococcus bohemicus]
MMNFLMILFLLAGLSLLVYIMNRYIIKLFKDDKTNNALVMLYVTMIASIIIVTFIAFCFRTILIDITDIFYRS